MFRDALLQLQPFTELPSPPDTITNDAARAAWFRDGSVLVEKGILDALCLGPFEILCQLEGQISEAIALNQIDLMKTWGIRTLDQKPVDLELIRVYRDLRADFGLPA